MNIVIPRFTLKPYFNKMWGVLRGTWVAPFLTHEAQGLSALHLLKERRMPRFFGQLLAQGWYDRPLRGAALGWESMYPLAHNEAETVPVDLSGANGCDFNIYDYVSVMEIGVGFTTAGTTTALVMDFDGYPRMAAGGTVVDKLDGTNGYIKAPNNTTAQAAGSVVYRKFGEDGSVSGSLAPIDRNKGTSINALVTTTITSGVGVPYVLVIPRAESNLNQVAANSGIMFETVNV